MTTVHFHTGHPTVRVQCSGTKWSINAYLCIVCLIKLAKCTHTLHHSSKSGIIHVKILLNLAKNVTINFKTTDWDLIYAGRVIYIPQSVLTYCSQLAVYQDPAAVGWSAQVKKPFTATWTIFRINKSKASQVTACHRCKESKHPC